MNQGQAEVELLDIANNRADSFETLIARPGFVLGKGDVKSFVIGLTGETKTISVHDLASALVDMTVHGGDVLDGETMADNLSLVRRAKGLRKV